MSASNYLQKSTLEYFFKGVEVAPSDEVFLALYISDPTNEDIGTEISGGSYDRQKISFGDVTKNGVKGVIQNDIRIEFPVATLAWGTISHYGIRTSSTGGELLASGAFEIGRQILQDDQLIIDIGGITITFE